MDSWRPSRAPGVNMAQQNQYSRTSRQWHNPDIKPQAESFNQQPRREQHNTQVDSWRSYKDDSTNLRSTTTSYSNLNAAAPSFQPAQNGSYYRPYEPLRTSDGAKERQRIEQTRKITNASEAMDTQPGLANRYSTRANRRQADQPLPSIEPVNLDYFIRTNSLNKSLESLQNPKYQRPAARKKAARATASPAPPSYTAKYKSQAQKEPVKVIEARKLLVILDLNGTLLYRTRTGSTKVYMRPGVTKLLDYLFSNHVVMVYTSAMPETAKEMVNQFLHPKQRNQLAAVWARDKLDLNKDQYHNKVQVYKKLDKVWKDAEIQAKAGQGCRWDQSNTVLVDDSKLKALAQPHNLLQILEYTKEDDPGKASDKAMQKKRHKTQVDILKQLELKLEMLKFQEDVSRLIRKWQSGEIAVPKLPGQEVSVEEDVDQKMVQQQKAADESEQANTARSQLLTPVSLVDGDTAEKPMEISDDDDDDGGFIISLTGSISGEERESPEAIQIPGLDLSLEDTKEYVPEERRSSESSIDEAVFQEMLSDKSK